MATKAVAKKASTALVSWEEQMAAAAAQQVEQAETVSTGQFLSVRAGQLTYNGQKIADSRLDTVVLDWIFENAYYEDDFDPDNPVPPVCYAFGRDTKTMEPHEKSSDKQHDTCAGCPQNEFGTADKGKGKACKNIVRLGLKAAKPLTVGAIEKGETAYMKVPVTSVKGWVSYVKQLGLAKRPTFGVVTEIHAEPDPKNQVVVHFTEKAKIVDREVGGAILACREQVGRDLVQPYPDAAPVEEKPARGAKKPAKAKKY